MSSAFVANGSCRGPDRSDRLVCEPRDICRAISRPIHLATTLGFVSAIYLYRRSDLGWGLPTAPQSICFGFVSYSALNDPRLNHFSKSAQQSASGIQILRLRKHCNEWPSAAKAGQLRVKECLCISCTC